MTADPDEAGAHNEYGRVLADQELFDQAIQEYRQADKLWQKEASKERKRALCSWADALREQEHYEQAAEKCQEAIELDLEFPDAYDGLGRVRAAQERFDEAIEQYRLADSLWQKKGSKDRKRALCNWADALREQGHYEQAAEKCQEAIDLDPEFPDAHHAFGRVRLAQERFDEAIELFRQADASWQKKGSKDRKRALRDWAHTLREQGHYEQAAEKCQEAIDLDPEFPDAHHAFGQVRLAQERFDEAIELFRQADASWQKKGSKDRKRALRDWAHTLCLQNHHEQAVEKCQEAIDVDRLDPWSHMVFGWVRAAQERFDEAIELFRQADSLCQKKGSKARKFALCRWAQALCLQNHHEQAAEKCLEAIDVDRLDPWSHMVFGWVRAAQERFDEAIEQYRLADSLWQKKEYRKLALCNWADALREQGHYEQAAEKCQEAIDLDPEFPDAHHAFGRVRSAQERFDEAIELFRQADASWQKKGSKARKSVLWNWAEALREQKRYEQAAEKCQEAIELDRLDPWSHMVFGWVRAAQERFDEAIELFRQADSLWQKKGSKARKHALWNWGEALRQQEKFEDAKAKFDCAREIVKGDAQAVYLYGQSLIDLGQYQDAIAQFDKVSALDHDDPAPRHVKASLLFWLGDYEEGWKEWRAARQCYQRLLGGELRGAEHLRKAVQFAVVLGEVFEYYEDSDKLYKRVLERQGGNADAWAGRAILNQQWANSDEKKPAEIHARLSYLMRRASELLKRQLGKGIDLQTYLALADLSIEFGDWTEAREQLDLAESVCGGSRLKHAQVTARCGLICYHIGEHAEAVKNFQQALLVRPEDLTLRSHLGNALLRLKQFETAQDEFARVLKIAPRNIDALRGAAQVCIELADDGDPDQYEKAVQYLSDALKYGRNEGSGSKHLSKSDLADIYHARGYVRIKSYEADASRTTFIAPLKAALDDFRNCEDVDPNYSKARVAIEKINKRLRQRKGELLVDVWGPVCIFCLSVVVFLIAQLFFIRTWWSPVKDYIQDYSVKDYILLTFSSLVFMVAAVYLPQLLKLKLPGIELEKVSVDQVSAPSIGIRRSESLIGRRFGSKGN